MPVTKSKVEHPITRRLRELGKNQSWLAKEMGCSETSISNYVSSKVILYKADTKTKKLLKILGITMNYLRTF